MSSPEAVKARGLKEDVKRQAELARADDLALRQLTTRSADLQATRVKDARRQADAGERRRGDAASTKKPEPPQAKIDHNRVAAERSAFTDLHKGRLHTPRPVEPGQKQAAETRRTSQPTEAFRAGDNARAAVADAQTAGRVATAEAASRVRNDNQAAVHPNLTQGSTPAARGETSQKGGLLSQLVKALTKIFIPTSTAPAAPSAPPAPADQPGKPQQPAATAQQTGKPTADAKPPRVTIHVASDKTDVDAMTKFYEMAAEGLTRFLPDLAVARYSASDQPVKNNPNEFVVGRHQPRDGSGSSGGKTAVSSSASRNDLATAVAIQRWNDSGSRRG